MRVIEGQKTKEEKVRTVKAAVCKTMAKTVAGVKLKKKKKSGLQLPAVRGMKQQ